MQDKSLNIIAKIFKHKFLNIRDTKIIRSPLDQLNNKNLILENYKIKTVDDINLGVSVLKPKLINEETVFILFCHGTGSNRHSTRYLFEDGGPLDRNVCVMLIDYREFAENDGDFNVLHVNFDVDACLKFFKRKFNPPVIHLMGHSLGTAILLEYIKFIKVNKKEQLFSKTILFSPFSSIIDVCKQFTIFKIACFVPGFQKFVEKKYGYFSAANVKFADSNSVLIIHGRNDSLVPYTQGLKISKEGNTSVLITEDDHDDVLINEYAWNKVFLFLDQFD